MGQNDLAVIQLLIREHSLTINQMVERLGVSANAVRQRLNRLQTGGLIDRTHTPEGRGRPSHLYQLTETGRRTLGHNLADLACALWVEVQSIPDTKIRESVMSGAIRRLAEGYSNRVVGDTTSERLRSAAQVFSERNIPVTVEENSVNGLPVLRVLQCPYPDLGNEGHSVCEMETELFSQVVGSDVELCQCRQEGDNCCTFQASTTTDNQ